MSKGIENQRSRSTRLISFVTACTLVVMPSLCIAAMYSVTGNKPQPPANYKRWPGLVNLVNQPTRQRLVWCNGAETFSYSGDTEALNSALQLFAKVECATHTVVLRPGPLFKKYDWELYISEGIDRAAIEKYDLKLVRDLDPTLVVYVSDKLKLDSVVFPPSFQVQQINDLRSRYLKAQQVGNDPTKRLAKAYLKTLDEDPVLQSMGTVKYEVQVRRIATFIQQLPKQR